MQAGGGGAGHLGQRRVGDIRGAREFGSPEIVGLVLEPGDLVRRHPAQDDVGAFGHGLDNDEVSEAFQQVLDEAAGIVAGLNNAVHGPEHGGGIGGGHGFHHVIKQRRVGVAQEGNSQFVVEAVGAGAGHQLIQHGQ